VVDLRRVFFQLRDVAAHFGGNRRDAAPAQFHVLALLPPFIDCERDEHCEHDRHDLRRDRHEVRAQPPRPLLLRWRARRW
jgi:hypothetical protein